MAAVKLEICMGTMCYMMGGADLRAVVEAFPDDIRQHIEISYSPCLNMCDKMQEPPYIKLNDRIISRVSKAGLLNIVKEELYNLNVTEKE